MDLPKISLIIPCYNGSRYIGRTIESVQAQTDANWEIVVVDDGSTDNSGAIVSPYAAQDSRIKLIAQANGGMCNARNAGFRASTASSEYLLFLDADDCLKPNMLELMSQHLDQHPNVGLVYCDYNEIGQDDELLEPENTLHLGKRRWTSTGSHLNKIPDECVETPFESFYAWNGVIPSVSLVRRSIYQTTAGWDEKFGQSFEEVNLNIEIALRSKLHYLAQPLVFTRIHAANATSTDSQSGRIWRQQKKLYHKWLFESLPKEEADLVKRAWYFRQHRLMPYLSAQWGWECWRKGEWAGGLKHFMRAVHSILVYYTTTLHRSIHGVLN